MLGRSIRDAIKSVIRNFSLSLASISCITITLIIVAIALIASFNVQNFTEAIEKDMTIVVFLDNDSDKNDIEEVEKEIKKISIMPYILAISVGGKKITFTTVKILIILFCSILTRPRKVSCR